MGYFRSYNSSDKKLLEFVVSPKDKKNAGDEPKLVMNAVRCEFNCQTNNVVDVETEEEFRRWSDASNWPNNTLPVANEKVVIDSSWNMMYDIEDSPIFDLVEINGKLTFDPEMNLTLRSRNIFVRGGELNVGNKTHPFQNEARFIMYGNHSSEHIAFSKSVEAGNKIIANVGKVNMYGKQRTKTMTRLRETALQGRFDFKVEAGLDIVPGDLLELLATDYDHKACENITVVSYDSSTGVVVASSELKKSHWGAPISTAAEYSGVDMRGEVLILSRNIKVMPAPHDEPE
jgi:hypothetical protein